MSISGVQLFNQFEFLQGTQQYNIALCADFLTHEQFGSFSKCNLFSNIVPYNCNISVWNWSNAMNLFSTLDIEGLVF